MHTAENFYYLNKMLNNDHPDLLFVVETWHQEAKMKNLLNTGYKSLYSTFSDEKGGGTAIIFKNTLLVAPLFPDFHTRNLLIARLSAKTLGPILLICLYLPPDIHRWAEAHAHLIRALDFIRNRYKSYALIAFGDLNLDIPNDPSSTRSKK